MPSRRTSHANPRTHDSIQTPHTLRLPPHDPPQRLDAIAQTLGLQLLAVAHVEDVPDVEPLVPGLALGGDEALLAMELGEASLSATASSVASVVSTALVTASTVAASLASSVPPIDGGGLASYSASDTISNVPTSSMSELSPTVAENTNVISSTVEEPTETSSSQHDEL